MEENNWDASSIYRILDTPRSHNFRSDVTVLAIDNNLRVVIGYSDNGSVFFGCPQVGQIPGFDKGRAKLEVLQSIDLGDRGVVEPALVLSFFVNSEEELSAIATIFAGLHGLNKSEEGSDKATLAAQGFEEYFAELPRIGISSEIETGLFGELAIIARSTKKEELVRGWHSSPDATYDFSFNSNRLEVKTSTRPTRLVWLRSSQTLSDSVPDLTYLSVYAPVDDAGLDLLSLVSLVADSLSPSLKLVFQEKLALYDLVGCKKRFDFRTAVESFRFISSNDVPVPIAEDPRILDLHWKCNFATLPNNGDSRNWL